MPKRDPIIEIALPEGDKILLPEDKIGFPEMASAGPIEAATNLFQSRTGREGIPSALKSGSAGLLRGLLEFAPQVPRGTALSGPSQIFSGQYLPELPEVEPLEKFKDFLKDVETSNDYTGKYYEGENWTSLFQKFSETRDPQDFDRFIDFTVNRVAQQLPIQAVLWGAAAAGVPAPLALSLLGVSSAGQRYSEDAKIAPQLSEKDRLSRAFQSGILEAGTEGLSYGLKGAALAGRSALEAIPGMKPIMAKALAKASSGVFARAAQALGATPARRLFSNALLNMFGEGFEEMANEAGQILSDEHYGVRMYTAQQKLDAMIEAFGISAIASGMIGSPMIAAAELQAGREVGNLPTPEELFTASHIIKVYKNGLEGSTNPDNQIHVVTSDVILLQSLVDDMIEKQEWNDQEGQGFFEGLGQQLKNALYDERGFVRFAGEGFTSYLEETINSKIPNKATPEQILRTLEGAGVPREEVEDMGLFDWLKGREKVTKQELLDFLGGNEIEILEVMKGSVKGDAKVDQVAEDMFGRSFGSLPVLKQNQVLDRIEELTGKTKFGSYTLPGGENYREVLLTLPVKREPGNIVPFEKWLPNQPWYQKWVSEGRDEGLARRLYNEWSEREAFGRDAASFRSSHFDEPNVLAHIRLNDRTDSAGRKTLFIEEIQSDWHQKGRKEGYSKPPRKTIIRRSGKTEIGSPVYDLIDETTGQILVSQETIQVVEDYKRSIDRENMGIPDAPFKKTWHELALKRILRMAAEEGYDAVAWTTGEQQAERYDLSKQVEEIGYKKEWGGDKYEIAISVKGRDIPIEKTLTKDELADHVGKEIAQKIINGDGRAIPKDSDYLPDGKSLSGLDLKVGGEGMKGFYDQIIPSFLNKYTKKWGGRVSNTKLPDEDLSKSMGLKDKKAYVEGETVHSLEITPAMRKAIMKGQPVYGSQKASGQEGFARFVPGEGWKDQPDEVKRGYNRAEMTMAINEVSKELRQIIADETESLKDFAGNFEGGQIIQNEKGGGFRTALPDMIKHPRTKDRPSSQKQWRELAVHNLENSKSVTGAHADYQSLKQQKKVLIEKLADMEMDAAQVQLNEREKATPKQIEEMSDEERSWFDLQAKQIEAFDDVPPSEYEAMDAQLGPITPNELKDISGVEMHLKDFYRNFEKVFGRHFQKVEKSVLRPLDESVNEYVEFQKRFTQDLKREIVDRLGIKKKSRMSAAVQLYGEEQITEQDLVREFGMEKAARIKEAAKWFRKHYDTMIGKVNDVRARIYPNNPDKLVPFRKNYFRHFHEMSELSGLKNLFDSPANIPSELAGTSQFTQPKSKWASFMQRRLGLLTDVDAVGGFLNYLPAAAQAIYVDPMIPKLRALEKKMRVLTHDSRNLNNFIEFLMMYSNMLAGKTNVWDRAIQQVVGRKKMRILDWVTRRVKRSMILFNLSSTVAQLFNLPQAIGKTKLHFATGTQDYLKSIFVKGGPHSRSLFLNTRYGSDAYDVFDTGIVNQPLKLAKWMLQVFDEVATKMTWYSFYDMAVANKIEDPIRYADTNTRKMVAGRAIHEVPIGQKSRTFQALQPFMIEVQNLWWVLGDQAKEKDFVGLVIFALASWLMNSGAEIIKGSRVSFDPINMLIEALSGDKTIPQRVGRILGEVTSNIPFGRQLQEFYPEYGWTTASGYKMPTRQQFFGEGDTTRFGNKILAFKAVTDFPLSLFAGGGQIKKTAQGAEALSQGYVTAGGKKIRFKTTIGTQVKALAFGKSAIPEVREYYKAQNDKKAKTKPSS